MDKKETALLHLQVPDWGCDQGKAGTFALEVKMAAEGCAGPKRAVSLARGKKGLVGKV